SGDGSTRFSHSLPALADSRKGFPPPLHDSGERRPDTCLAPTHAVESSPADRSESSASSASVAPAGSGLRRTAQCWRLSLLPRSAFPVSGLGDSQPERSPPKGSGIEYGFS